MKICFNELVILSDVNSSLHSALPNVFRDWFSEIQESLDSLEEWLGEMENTLQPLPLNSRWSKKAINEKMKELKVSLIILSFDS